MTNIKFSILIILIGFISGFAGLYFAKNSILDFEESETNIFFNSVVKDIDDQDVRLSKYKNNWLLVNFWATWCAPCREEIPELNNLFDNNKKFNIIGIAIDDMQAVKKFLVDTPIRYDSLISDNIRGVEISKSLGNSRGVLPFTVLIKPNGKIQDVFYGKFDVNALNNYLKDTIK